MLKLNVMRLFALIFVACVSFFTPSYACTGISFIAKDGSKVIARTMEWGGFRLPANLILVPRGYTQHAVTPTGKDGLLLETKYGYAGIGVLEENFVAEAMNEKGMVGELFYFPGYGEFEEFNPERKKWAITDAQFLAWVLGNFATVDEMLVDLPKIHLITYGKGFQSAHFNITDASGHHVVIEFYNGKFNVHENKIGVITNAPTFDWHMTNLNTYVNVFASTNKPREVGRDVTIKAFGVGSAAHGLPGDLTPTSRFVRAAFYSLTAPERATGYEAAMQSFQILNNFDIPIGTEFNEEERDKVPEMMSATQWTTACDTKDLKFYYRTEWNYTIRCIDLKEINFATARYQVLPLDNVKEYPVEYVHFK